MKLSALYNRIIPQKNISSAEELHEKSAGMGDVGSNSAVADFPPNTHGIDTGYELKKQPFNISWKRFTEHRNVTVSKRRIFKNGTKFFAIGSCFANELRDALERNKFDAIQKPRRKFIIILRKNLKNLRAGVHGMTEFICNFTIQNH